MKTSSQVANPEPMNKYPLEPKVFQYVQPTVVVTAVVSGMKKLSKSRRMLLRELLSVALTQAWQVSVNK